MFSKDYVSQAPEFNISIIQPSCVHLLKRKDENLQITRLDWPSGVLQFQLVSFLSWCHLILFAAQVIRFGQHLGRDLQTRPYCNWINHYTLCNFHDANNFVIPLWSSSTLSSPSSSPKHSSPSSSSAAALKFGSGILQRCEANGSRKELSEETRQQILKLAKIRCVSPRYACKDMMCHHIQLAKTQCTTTFLHFFGVGQRKEAKLCNCIIYQLDTGTSCFTLSIISYNKSHYMGCMTSGPTAMLLHTVTWSKGAILHWLMYNCLIMHAFGTIT